MAESDYKVSLGIELNEKQLNAVKTTINNLVDKERKIDINIDFNILNANKLSNVGREIEEIKKQVKELNNSGANGKNKPLLSVDSKSIEASLKKINESISKLQNAFGKVDSKKGVQSLLTTVNKIRAALDGVSKQFVDLNKNLTALSNKNFDFKFDFGLNDKNSPERIMNEFKMLRKEAEAYENYFNKEYSSRIKSDRQFGGIFALASEFDKSKQTQLASLLSIINNGGDAGSAKTNAALREYINLIKEIMALSNGRYKSDIVESRLAGDESFIKMKNELSETEKQLKEIFSGGINAEKLHLDISGIVEELGKIQLTLDTLSKGFAIEDMTKSFQEMSSVLKQLTDNAELLKDALGAVVSNASGNIPKATNNINKQAEKLISDKAQKAIKDVTSKQIEVPFKVTEKNSKAFEDEMNNLVKRWTDGKGNLVDVKIETRTNWSETEKKNIEELHRAHVTYQNAAGESIKKTIEWKKIGSKTNNDGKAEDIYGFVEASAKYSKSIDKTKTQTDNFAKQQKKAVSDLTNTINQLNSAAIDQNAARPIKDQKHLSSLEAKYKEITDAITRMGNASRDTFDDERNNVNKLISEYKVMKSEFKNAENVANKLSGTDYKSGRNIAEQNLAEFKTKAADYAAMSATLEKLDKSFANVGDASSLKEFNNELRVAKAELAKVKAEANAANLDEKLKIDVSSLTGKITDLQKVNPQIVDFKAKIGDADVSVEDLLNDLSNVKTDSDFRVVSKRFKEFENAAESAGIAVKNVAVKAKDINQIRSKLSDIGFNGFTQEISRASTEVQNISRELEKTGESSEQLKLALQNVENAFNAINEADKVNDTKALTLANEEYEESMKRLYSLIKLYDDSMDSAFTSDIFGLDKANELLRLEGLFEQGSAAAKVYGEKVEELRREIDACADNKGLTKIKKEISALEKEVKKSGLHTKTFGSTIKESFSKYFSYFSVSSVFMYAEQALRSMFEQVKLIDSAMTELKKVTDETDESYNQFLKNVASRAKELGTTIDGLVASTADFARLGYGFEDSQKLAEVANIYAVVGDEIEGVEDATQSLVSTLAAFKSEMNGMSDSDFAMSIVDKMNEVSNNFAISSGGIGEALQRSASSMAAANNSLDETIAMITAANTVAQNPEKVGKGYADLKNGYIG